MKILVCLGYVAVLWVLSACSPLQSIKQETINTYRIEVPLNPISTAPVLPFVLVVAPPRAAAGFETARMAYLKQTYQLNYFVKNRWVDTPAHMLQPLLMQILERQARFQAVIAHTSPIDAQLRLETEIVRLQQEFDRQPSQIHLTLHVQLINLVKREVLASREIDFIEPATSDDPYGGVIAANRAVRHALDEIVNFIRVTVQKK